LKIVET